MIAQDCEADTADSKSTTYPSHVVSHPALTRVAEEESEYSAKSEDENELNTELMRLEVQARRQAVEGQIKRLRGITRLLSTRDTKQDSSSETLKQLAIDLEQVATIIEDEVVGMVYLVLDGSESDRE